jgi:large subunit ribosomal protein L1
MGKRGKAYAAARKLIDSDKKYDLDEAIALIKKTSTAKYDETIEISINLGVDPRKADQMVRGALVLPHGTGKVNRVVVFAKGEKAEEARAAGADEVGEEELGEKIKGGWLEFDKCIATPDMMRIVGQLGRVLGPRGMMPNPKVGTVTFDVGRVVKEMKGGRVEYRTEKNGIVQTAVGKASFEEDHLRGNVLAVVDNLMRARPQTAKGIYMKSIALSSTHGPGVRLDPLQVQQQVKV